MDHETVLPVLVSLDERRALTSARFHQLAQVPAEAEWFANIDNPQTRRAYRNDLWAPRTTSKKLQQSAFERD